MPSWACQEAAKQSALVLGKRKRKATVYNENKLANGGTKVVQSQEDRRESGNDTDFQPTPGGPDSSSGMNSGDEVEVEDEVSPMLNPLGFPTLTSASGNPRYVGDRTARGSEGYSTKNNLLQSTARVTADGVSGTV